MLILDAEHGTSRCYRHGCRCEECRRYKLDANRAYAKARRDAGNPIDYAASRPKIAANCETCGTEFGARAEKVRAGNGRFCSTTCRNIGNNRARGFAPRPTRAQRFRQRAMQLVADASTGTSGGSRVFVQGNCLVCEASFMSRRRDSRYCSTECRRQARSSARHWIDFPSRKAIYKRDGWRCCLCREHVARRYDANDPLSATLDHIVPRSQGGSDDMSNLRLLCAGCNSKRGDLTYFSDEELAA